MIFELFLRLLKYSQYMIYMHNFHFDTYFNKFSTLKLVSDILLIKNKYAPFWIYG